MKTRNALIAASLVILLVGFFWLSKTQKFFGEHLTLQNSNNGLISQNVPTSVNLDDICNCQIITSDGSSVGLLDSVTGEVTTTVSSSGTGEGGTSQPSFLTISPTGLKTLLVDQEKNKVFLVDSATGKTIRSLDLAAGRFVDSWAWSPDESTLLLMTDQQSSNGVPSKSPTQVIKWTEKGRATVPVPSSRPKAELNNILSVNNDGSQIIIGWSTGTSAELYGVNSDLSLSKIDLPSVTINAQNSSPILSAISNGHALLAVGPEIYRVDLATLSTSSIFSDALSLYQISPVSPDGDSILIAHHRTGTAHSQVTRYIPSINTTVDIVPTFDIGDGFQKSTWLPGGRFLALHNSYGNKWYVIDVSLGQVPLHPLTLPTIDLKDQTTGFFQTSPMTDEKMELYDLGGHELSPSEKQVLETKITDWSLYQPETQVKLLPGECGFPEADKQTTQLNASDKRSYLLNGGMQLIETPNLFHWDAAGLKLYTEKSICGVGGPFPNALVDGKILWWQQCAGGAGYNSSSADTNIRCVQAEEVVNHHFKMGRHIQ